MKKWPCFGLLFLLLEYPIALKAQRIENLRANFSDGKVTVLYDIIGGKESQTYSIQVYGSHNNYSIQLRTISGDVGEGVKAGKDLKIVWDAEADLTAYSGGITFRVQGSVMPLKLFFISPNSISKVRRGKTTTLQWEGGIASQQYKIDLYQGSTRIATVGDVKNSGNYLWSIPKDLGKGEYTLQITAPFEKATSEVFSVKAKVPLVWKILPGVLVAGIIPLLIKPSPGPEKLPVAPDPN